MKKHLSKAKFRYAIGLGSLVLLGIIFLLIRAFNSGANKTAGAFLTEGTLLNSSLGLIVIFILFVLLLSSFKEKKNLSLNEF